MQFDAPRDYGAERRNWHVEKTINLSEVFTALSMLCCVFWLGGRLEERIGQLERQRSEDIARIEKTRAEDISRSSKERDEVLRQLDSINSKLDRLAMPRGRVGEQQ